MTMGMARTPGDLIAFRPSLAPVAGTGSAQNGASVDRQGFFSALVVLAWSTSGGVTGGGITVKLQDSADGSTGWLDFGAVASVTIPAGPNASGVLEVSRNLDGAKRYIRAVVDSDPTGGSPASIVAATIGLANADKLPAV